MILTVVQCYVSEKERYANGFVHARVKQYKENGIDSKVFVLSNKAREDYNIEGVDVKTGTVKELKKYVEENNVSSICFHFLNPSMLKALKKINKKIPIVIFVHGNEALYWYERIFPDRFRGFIRILKFIKYVIVNTYSISLIRKFFKETKRDIQIICVSNWMKNVTLKNWKLNASKIKIHIIPNIVNENIFDYVKKDKKLRYNVLMIRNFNSGKYALDIAMDTIIELTNYPEFKNMHFTIFGDGWLYEKYTNRIKKYENVELHKGLLSQKQISDEHKKNGIFLCPTRQDAQGVSMCEAMSSGLVPISSNNTAIPEFLPDEYNLALSGAKESAKRIIELIRNGDEFIELSAKVSSFIKEKCSIAQTTEKELNLIKELNSEK